MTLILGWKTGENAYLLGDKAVTYTYAGEESEEIKTSFEENTYSNEKNIVVERQAKIFNFKRVALGFSGDWERINAFLDTFKQALGSIDDVRQALERTVISLGPYHSKNEIKLIAVIPKAPGSSLLYFDPDKYQNIQEVTAGNAIMFGSAQSMHLGQMKTMLSHIYQNHPNDPQSFLATVLGFVQSLGVNNYTMEHGFGGAYSGLYATQESIEWQADLLFCLYSDFNDPVSFIYSIIRDNGHVVRTTKSKGCSYFLDTFTCGPIDEWKAKWYDEAFDIVQKAKFDFVIFLNKQHRIISVFEMLKNEESDSLKMASIPLESGEGDFRLEIVISPLCKNDLTVPVEDRDQRDIPIKLNWFPWKPCSE